MKCFGHDWPWLDFFQCLTVHTHTHILHIKRNQQKLITWDGHSLLSELAAINNLCRRRVGFCTHPIRYPDDINLLRIHLSSRCGISRQGHMAPLMI